MKVNRFYAALLLSLMLAARAGQQVHIYTEDPLHFAAFAGDLMTDNGALCGFVQRHVVDNYCFFPFLEEAQPGHTFYAVIFAVVRPEATRCKSGATRARVSLRAPPSI